MFNRRSRESGRQKWNDSMRCFSKTVKKKSKIINENEIKPLCHFIRYSSSGFKCFVFVLALLAFVAWILCRLKSINLIGIQDSLNTVLEFLYNHRSAIDGWAYSYIAGVLVYYLTVVLPEAKRGQALLPSICERIRYIEDTFSELSRCLCYGDWSEDHSLLKNAIVQLKQYGKTESDNYYKFDYCFFILHYAVSEIDKYTDFILQLHEVLPAKDLKNILDVKYCSVLDKIRSEAIRNTLFNEDDAKEFLEELREENMKIKTIHKRIYNKIYKHKYEG